MAKKAFWRVITGGVALIVGSLIGSPSGGAAAATPGQLGRTVVGLDSDWQILTMPAFHRWKPEPVLTAAQLAGLRVPRAAARWSKVQLPNDYIVAGKITPRAANSHGSLPVYPAWYRRRFTVPVWARDKTIWLNFGGVYRDSVVFVNGRLVGQHPSGYSGFRYNISRWVHFGGSNTLAVFVDPRFFEGWWYEGGGIYRHVRLIIVDKLHVAPWGTFVISKVTGPIQYGSPTGAEATARLTIETTVINAFDTPERFTLSSAIFGPSNKLLTSVNTPGKLGSQRKGMFTQHITLNRAALWSLRHCNLYHLATTIQGPGKGRDDKRTTFGIRTLDFDPDHGFVLDGKHVEIKGTCNHQDFPGVGIGVPDNLWAWRIRKLKALGCNAYRTAHNPLASAFYRACNHLGMLVMDENRHLGDVYTAKTPNRAPYSNLSDLKWMILAQRNDPCVIFWSMCNEEVYTEASRYGKTVFTAMMDLVHRLDPTRPVTCAYVTFPPTHAYFGHGFMKIENILGCNYGSRLLPALHRQIPNKMIFGSENENCFSDRGVVKTDVKAGLINEFGQWPEHDKMVYIAGHAPWRSAVPILTHPFIAGEFVWTGFNYRGEPNPIHWPDVTSRTGMMDLAGFRKPCAYYWRACWKTTPSVYIFPSWTFPAGQRGKPLLIRCFSNCQRVELFLNGRPVGDKIMPRYRYLDFTVRYRPGTLMARGYDGSRLVASFASHTAGPAASMTLTDEIPTLTADGESIAPIAVRILDSHGVLVPQAANLVNFSVSGPGTIVGVCNGSSASHESNVDSSIHAFNGLCLVLVRAGNRPGVIRVVARAAGMPAAHLALRTQLRQGAAW